MRTYETFCAATTAAGKIQQCNKFVFMAMVKEIIKNPFISLHEFFIKT